MGPDNWRRAGWCALSLWVALVLLAGWWLAPALTSDVGWGILAAEQSLHGYSEGIRRLVVASPSDLAQQTSSVISWWAPAYQAVPFLLRVAGQSWGVAVTATGLLCFVLGISGWALCFRRLAPAAPLPWLLLLVALSRFAHSSLYIYEGESLAFAAFPWALLCNLTALRHPSLLRISIAASATVLLFVVKYSLLVQMAGCYAAWILLAGMRRIPLQASAMFLAVSLLVLGLLTVVGNIPGGPTPGSVTEGIRLERALDSAAWLPLAVTDLDSLIAWAFSHPTRNWLQPGMKTVLGLVLLLPFAKLLWVQSQQLQWRSIDSTTVLALCTIVGGVAVMTVLLAAQSTTAPATFATRR